MNTEKGRKRILNTPLIGSSASLRIGLNGLKSNLNNAFGNQLNNAFVNIDDKPYLSKEK